MDSDYMEMGEGLIPLSNGWYIDKQSGNKVDVQGNVFDKEGDLIWSPDIVDPDEEYER